MAQPIKISPHSASGRRETSQQRLTVDRRPMTTGDIMYSHRLLNSPVSAPSSASSKENKTGRHYFFTYERQSSNGSSEARSTPGAGSGGPFIYRGLKHSVGGRVYLKTGFVNQIESDEDTIHGSKELLYNEEYNAKTRLTFLTESGQFSPNKSASKPQTPHETDCTPLHRLPGSNSREVCEDEINTGRGGNVRIQPLRPHTVADCRRDDSKSMQRNVQFSEISDQINRPGTSWTVNPTLEYGYIEQDNGDLPLPNTPQNQNDSVGFSPTPRRCVSKAASSSIHPESRPESVWSGIREAMYANGTEGQYSIVQQPTSTIYDRKTEENSSLPWLEQFMTIKKNNSIQMAMCNSSSKLLRKLGTKSGRCRKNPWKGREKHIWQNRNKYRIINKPTVKKVEITQEEKEQKIQTARRRLGWVFSMVYWSMHCFNTMIELSMSITRRSGVEMQWHSMHSNKSLAFNPANFSKARIQAKMPQWARTILDKPPEERTETECRRLHAMMRGYPSFDKFTELIQLAMCRSLEYLFVHAQRVVLREGHIGQNFYFVYSGSVFVNVTEDCDDDDLAASKSDSNLKDQNRMTENEKIRWEKERNTIIKTEAVLSKGDSFGELALLQDEPRQATVSCRVDSELLKVDKEVFSQVCPKIFDGEMEQKQQFIRTLPLFDSHYWDKDAIYKLCFEAHLQQYMTNKVICSNSKDDSWVYICIEGICHIIKCLNLDKDSSNEELSADKLEEELQITAEFLNTMDRAAKSKGRQEPRTNVNQALFKQRMLDSLSLDYAKTVNKQQKKREREDNGLVAYQEETKTDPDAIITMTSLMRRNKAEGKNNIVYLKIGLLHPGEVFDLSEILQPSHRSTSSDLILVSGGAQLFRVRRSHFHSIITPQALDHARHIAKKTSYPSEATLLSSYKTESKWQVYRDQVIDDALQPLRDLGRRRTVLANQNNASDNKKDQTSRLLSTLQKNKQREQRLLAEQKRREEKESMALDFIHLPTEDDKDFEVECNQNQNPRLNSRVIYEAPALARRSSISTPKPFPRRLSKVPTIVCHPANDVNQIAEDN